MTSALIKNNSFASYNFPDTDYAVGSIHDLRSMCTEGCTYNALFARAFLWQLYLQILETDVKKDQKIKLNI